LPQQSCPKLDLRALVQIADGENVRDGWVADLGFGRARRCAERLNMVLPRLIEGRMLHHGVWVVLYAYGGRPTGVFVGQALMGATLLALAAWQYLRSKRGLAPGPYGHDVERGARALLLTLAGLALLGLDIGWEMGSRHTIEAVRARTCMLAAGRVTNIAAQSAGGEMSFSIGARPFHYNTHSNGFSGQLCRDLPLCTGDTARLCLDGDAIGRIEKWQD
jgi:hypothetical protein